MDSKGQGIPGGINMIVLVIVMLAIAMTILYNVTSAFDTNLAASDYGAGWNATKTNSATAFNMLSIVPIVLGAGLLFAALYMYMRG